MKLQSNQLLVKRLCVVAIGFILLFAACKPKDPDCYQSVIVLNYTQFQTRYRDTIHVFVDSITQPKVDSITKIRDSAMGTPELLVIDEDTAYKIFGQNIALLPNPFNPAKDSIRYRFSTDTNSTFYDTLTFYYTPTPHFINNSCGYTYYYNLDKVKTTNHMLDSSSIINPSLTDKNRAANVIFYFKLNP